MKKKYIRPTLDVVASQLSSNLMDHSNDWGGAKETNGFGDEDQENENGQIQIRNLWDD